MEIVEQVSIIIKLLYMQVMQGIDELESRLVKTLNRKSLRCTE